MSLKLNSSGGGSVLLQEPTTASNRTVSLPDGSGTIAVQGVSSNIVSGTAVSASGTSVNFTDIPSWVKRITVMFNGTSLSGTSNYLVQIGSGSVTTSGYSSAGSVVPTGSAIVLTSTSGFIVRNSQSAPTVISGSMVLNLVSSNSWVSSHAYGDGTGAVHTGGGTVSLSGTLDRVRITTVNGTDTFDAGTINILYE